MAITEKKKVYLKAYRQRRKEHIRKVSQARYLKTRERRLQQSREWQKKHIKQVIEQHKRYYRENPQRWQTRTKTQQQYGYLMKGAVCELCGMENNLQFHHTTEPYELDKFKILCVDCHRKIHKKSFAFDKQEVKK